MSAASWSEWLVTGSGQLLALGLAAWLLDRLWLQRAAPALREAVWAFVLLRPLLPAALPWAVEARLAVVGAFWRVGEDAMSPSPGGRAWLLGGWLAGAVILALVGAVLFARRVHALGAERHPTDPAWHASANAAARRLGLRRLPQLVATAAPWAPCVTGWFWPQVFVPIDPTLSPVAREHALLHEFAHVQRRDPWRASLALALLVVFWFHPMAWLAFGRWAHAREVACDQRAARRATGGARAYAATLLSFVGRRTTAFGLSPAMGGGRVAQRVRAVLDADRSRRLAGFAAAFALLVVAGLTSLTPAAAAARATAAEADAVAFDLPSASCLQRHYLILSALAHADAASSTEVVPFAR